MSAITLVNSTQDNAEFRVSSGPQLIARVGVHGSGEARVPTSGTWQVQAFTTINDFSLTSNSVAIDGTSAVVVARVLFNGGTYDFQLVLGAGMEPAVITAQNTCVNPVQFAFTRAGMSVPMVLVVDEHNSVGVSTMEQWTVYAIVNGITTATVTVDNPNATITVMPDNNDDGFTLQVA